MNDKPDVYYRTVEVADLLGIDPTTVVLWIKKGDLQAEKINPLKSNSPYRVPRSEVLRILELRKQASQKTPGAL